MKYLLKDPKTGAKQENDLSVLPYVSIPRDTLVLMTELMTPEQIGNVLCDLTNELYCDNQYSPIINSNTEKVMYKTLIDNIGRLSAGYFKKIKNLNQNRDK